MRLDKFLAHAGIGTRKEVKEFIRKSRVEVNGVVVKKDDIKIDENNDVICIDGEEIVFESLVYYMLNKPSGVVSATMDDMHKTVLECFDCMLPRDTFPVGRLDIDTEGLLLISNDGKLAHQLLSPKKHVDKTYYVQTQLALTREMLEGLSKEIVLKDDTYQPGIPSQIGEKELYLTIQEGKFHQVKRMLHHVGNEVVYLKRVSMGSLQLDESLKPGEYRSLTEEELSRLRGE